MSQKATSSTSTAKAVDPHKTVKNKIKIFVGSCNRLSKEIKFYEKEAASLQKQIEKQEAEKIEPFTIRQTKQCLQESVDARKFVEKKLEKFQSDLKGYMSKAKDLQDFDTTFEPYQQALSLLSILEPDLEDEDED